MVETVSLPWDTLSLVLLPGLDGSGQLFRWFQAALPTDLKVSVIDFPPDACTYAAIEAHVLSVLPLDVPFVLLGESFSGPLALRIAARNPRNLVSVVLVATFLTLPVAWIPRWVRALVKPFMFGLPGRATVLNWFLLGRTPSAELVAAAIACVEAVDRRILAGRAKAALAVDATGALAECRVPILFLHGSQDRLIAPPAEKQIRILQPAAEIAILDAPHFLLQCAPHGASQAVTRFLARVWMSKID